MSSLCTVNTLNSLDPIWSISQSTATVAGAIEDYISLTDGKAKVASTVKKTAGLASVPRFGTQVVNFISDVFSREEKSVRSLVMDGLGIAGGACDCIVAANNCGWLDVGKSIPVVGAISDAVTLVTDGADFFEEIKQVEKNNTKMEKTHKTKRKNYYSAKSSQAMLRVAKKLVSVAMAAFCLLSLFFSSIATFGIVFVAASVVYLTLNIVDGFYSRSIDDKKKSISCNNYAF